MLKLIMSMIVTIMTAAGQTAGLHALMTKPGQFSHYHQQLSSLQHSQAQHQQAAMAAAFGTITICI